MNDDDLRGLLDAMRQETSAAHEDTRRHFDALENNVERVENKLDATADGLRRHFDVVTEGTKHDIRLVAESVSQLTEEVRRAFTALDTRIDRTAAETQAMINRGPNL